MQPTEHSPIELRRKRSFGEVISDSIAFIRQNFKSLMWVVILTAGPFMLMSAVYSGITQVKFSNIFYLRYEMGTYMRSYSIGAFFAVLSTVVLNASVLCYIKQYVALKRQPRMEEVWRSLRSDFWKLLGIMIILFILFFVIAVAAGASVGIFQNFFSVLVVIGAFVAIVYMAVKFSLSGAAAIVGDDSVFNSMSRSWDYTKGHFWNTFGLLFVLTLITGLIGVILAVPAGIMNAVVIFSDAYKHEPGLLRALSIALNILASLVSQAAYIILITGTAFYYLSLEERNEGFGLMERIEQMDAKENNLGEEHY